MMNSVHVQNETLSGTCLLDEFSNVIHVSIISLIPNRYPIILLLYARVCIVFCHIHLLFYFTDATLFFSGVVERHIYVFCDEC